MVADTMDAWQRAIEAEAAANAGPELVVAVVTPVGTNTLEFVDKIRGALAEWHYTSTLIKVSDHFGSTGPAGEHEDDRVNRLIDAGNTWCKTHNSSSGVAPLAVELIRTKRVGEHLERCQDGSDELASQPLKRHAFILHSLKRPGEVSLLQWVYGERLIVIGTQLPVEDRVRVLSDRLRTHAGITELQRRGKAEELIQRDSSESDRFGQDLAKTYPLCDIFVGADGSLTRPIAVLFGDSREAPTSAEHAMYVAWSTAARSLTSSRRVGATILRGESILAVGMNEVPSISDLTPDSVLGYDYSEQAKNELASKVLAFMADAGEAGWLKPERVEAYKASRDQFMADAAEVLRKSPLSNIIEFQRPVHAEMWALMDAARRGVSVEGAELYCTTYPCHLCWKHVFAAGISKQYYIDIYPKSLASAMYDTTRSMLEPYVGIAPTRYLSFFRERTLSTADAFDNFPPPHKESANPLARTTAFTTSDTRELSVIATLRQAQQPPTPPTAEAGNDTTGQPDS